MAGDWIKFEKSTLDKPEVFEIASALNIDPDAVIGKLLRVWDWFDDQSSDGNASVTVRALLDRYTGVTGFTEAMESAGWLIIDGDIMSLPNFGRHNGKTAKTRALTAKRVSKSRSKSNGESNIESVTPSLPEKRREEKSKESVSITKPKADESSKPPKFTPPTIEEFTNYLIEEMPKINAEWTRERVEIAAQLQFETYAENNWKDGNNKPIKIWKTKSKNAFTYKKPWNYGNDSKGNHRGSMPARSGNGSQQKSTGAGDGIEVPII